jgi:methylmalonyl-CoA/ethylmalonyl-CoA epimerase
MTASHQATQGNTQQDNAPVSIARLGQIALTVHDVPRAVAFYRDALGIRLLEIPAPPSLAFFDCAGVRLMLSLPESAGAGPSSSVLYFHVPDIHGAVASLRHRGVEFVAEPHLIARMSDHELWMAFFTDPDRNPLALMCEVRPPASPVT